MPQGSLPLFFLAVMTSVFLAAREVYGDPWTSLRIRIVAENCLRLALRILLAALFAVLFVGLLVLAAFMDGRPLD